MTLEVKILRDLRAGQSTADSIAGRLAVPTQGIESVLKRQLAAGHVTTALIGGRLIVYQITDRGRGRIDPLSKP